MSIQSNNCFKEISLSKKMSAYIEIIAFFLFQTVSADIEIYYRNGMGEMIADFQEFRTADFGDSIPSSGMSAFLVYSNPELACSRIDPPPRNVTNFTKHWGVLIKRGICSFEEKVVAAQNMSYDLVIVYNNMSDFIETMHAENPEKVYIPSIFVGLNTGLILKEKYLSKKGFYLKVQVDYFNPNQLLIPFLIVISLCLITMLGFLIVKCIKDRRRARRRRLPNSSLKKIPTAKFRKGDPYETCAICLDDFVEGEKLRILPCSHAYHCKCVDPWLTRNRRVCPMCKRKVFPAGERAPSDTDSASEEDDQTPLLRNAQQTYTYTLERELANIHLRRATVAAAILRDAEFFRDYSSSSSHSGSLAGETSRSKADDAEPTEHQSGDSPQSGRSPSRNALIGSREEVNPERSEIII